MTQHRPLDKWLYLLKVQSIESGTINYSDWDELWLDIEELCENTMWASASSLINAALKHTGCPIVWRARRILDAIFAGKKVSNAEFYTAKQYVRKYYKYWGKGQRTLSEAGQLDKTDWWLIDRYRNENEFLTWMINRSASLHPVYEKPSKEIIEEPPEKTHRERLDELMTRNRSAADDPYTKAHWNGREWDTCTCSQKHWWGPSVHMTNCPVYCHFQTCTCGKVMAGVKQECRQHPGSITITSPETYTYSNLGNTTVTNSTTYQVQSQLYQGLGLSTENQQKYYSSTKENTMFRTATARTIKGTVGQVVYRDTDTIVWESEAFNDLVDDEGKVTKFAADRAVEAAQTKINEVVAGLFSAPKGQAPKGSKKA